MGAVVPGPLLGRVIRAGLGGVVEKVFNLLLDSVFLLGSSFLAVKRPSHFPPFGGNAQVHRARSLAHHYKEQFRNAGKGERVLWRYLRLRGASRCPGCDLCELC